MKISGKLLALQFSAILAIGILFAFDLRNNLADVRQQENTKQGVAAGAVIHEIAEAFIHHELLFLKGLAGGSFDKEQLSRVKNRIRDAVLRVEDIEKFAPNANETSRSAFEDFRSAWRRLIDLQPEPSLSIEAVSESHDRAGSELAWSASRIAAVFEVLGDSESDVVLASMNVLEVYPKAVVARAKALNQVVEFHTSRNMKDATPEDVQKRFTEIIKSMGSIEELGRLQVRNVSRATKSNSARGWQQRAKESATNLEAQISYHDFVNDALAVATTAPLLPLVIERGGVEMQRSADALRSLLVMVERILDERLERTKASIAVKTAALLILVVVTFVLMVYVARGVSRSIASAAQITGKVAGGEFDLEVEGTDKTDEIGELMRAVDVLRKNSRRLSMTAAEVSEAVEAIQAAASEISQGSSDLAVRTERQASALQETVATMSSISVTVGSNAESSEKARGCAMDAVSRAELGGAAVSSVVAAMSGIEDSSSRIADIILVMEEISFQTKLLALNAAVEAARAGESGKGFAVVAQEVRSLADRSREASQQIRDLIAQSSREVSQGVKLAGEAGEALSSIIESVRRVSELAPEIAAGSREQARSIEEINKALTDLDSATQQNAALVEESSSSSRSLADQARRLVDVIANSGGSGAAAAAPAQPGLPKRKTGHARIGDADQNRSGRSASLRARSWDDDF